MAGVGFGIGPLERSIWPPAVAETPEEGAYFAPDEDGYPEEAEDVDGRAARV